MSSPFCLNMMMGATCVLPACFLLYWCYMFQYTNITTSKLNWKETHTILPTFLGSTQEAHMGATCMLPSVASLTGRSVLLLTYISHKNKLLNDLLTNAVTIVEEIMRYHTRQHCIAIPKRIWGSFNNYVDQFWPTFDHLSTLPPQLDYCRHFTS